MKEKDMDFLRTPDERFENLPGYAFEPHYVQLGVVPNEVVYT